MSDFEEKFAHFIKEFGVSQRMVLSTSYHDNVSSRMMSIVLIDNKFYFQTDKNFRKYEQLTRNPNVSLCIDNITIEGRCKEVGKPSDNAMFTDIFRKEYSSAYERYTNKEDEVLFEVRPIYIQRWIYEEGVSFIETFDIPSMEYEMREYK